MRLAAIIIIFIQALLSGCATTQGTTEVRVPLAVPCVKQSQIPAQPTYTKKDELMKLDRRLRTLTVYDEREQLKADDDQMRALLQACSGGDQ